MGKAAILALADRVEALTGPDYSVQVAIFKALHPEYAGDEWQPFGLGLRHQNDSSDVRTPPDRSTLIPSYLFSIDAAMTLVPGTTIAASFDWPPGIEGATCGAVLTLVTLEGTRDVKAVSCTPAAAITAAALRAIAGGEDAN